MLGNDFAGISRQGAICGCRRCEWHKSALADLPDQLHVMADGRTRQKAARQLSDALVHTSLLHLRHYKLPDLQAQSTGKMRKAALVKRGLKPEGAPLEGVSMDLFESLPHDPFHSEYLGICKLLLSWFALSLTDAALLLLNKLLAAFHRPGHWRQLAQIVLSTGSNRKPRLVKQTGCEVARIIQVTSVAQLRATDPRYASSQLTDMICVL
jgi:hypothetical protein